MWMIGKVNQVERKYVESIAKEVRSIEEYDMGRMVDGYPVLKDNEEFVAVYIDGDMIKDLETLTNIKKDSKKSEKRRYLHKDRLEVLEEILSIKVSQLRSDGINIESYDDWSCDGDIYSLMFDYIDDNDGLITGSAEVVFVEGSIEIKDSIWCI